MSDIEDSDRERECFCQECPDHNWNPWKPDVLTLEEGIDRHNEMFHGGEDVAEIRYVDTDR